MKLNFWYLNMQKQVKQQNRGKRNWRKVRSILLQGRLANRQSKKKYELFEKKHEFHLDHSLTTYCFKDLRILQITPTPVIKHLVQSQGDVDTTGNWIWEAEEVGAYYLIARGQIYLNMVKKQHFKVLELGAGTSAMASIAFSLKWNKPETAIYIEATDGKQENISFLAQNLVQNNVVGEASLMLWNNQECKLNKAKPSENRLFYDLIIVCDCLFFKEYHQSLIQTLDSYMDEQSVALLFNPSRGDTMNSFFKLAEQFSFSRTNIVFEDPGFKLKLQLMLSKSNLDVEKDIVHIIELRKTKKDYQ